MSQHPTTPCHAHPAAPTHLSQVSLYGFTPYRGVPGERFRYRYFDAQEASLGVHSFDLALEAIELLAEQVPLRVVRAEEGGGGGAGAGVRGEGGGLMR